MVSLTEIPPQEDLQPKTKQTPKKSSTSEAMMAQPRDILAFFLLFRLINALCVRTFFQPDEYFQALEPAWSMAFGPDSGAWLTWVLFD
jgi:phosphatidylinositol glycan class B